MTNKFDRIHTDTNNKYIVRNCPAYSKDALDFCFAKNATQAICYNCTNCIMKQIVELAKGHTELCKNCEQQIKECDCSDICNAYRLDRILKLLDIQEVE